METEKQKRQSIIDIIFWFDYVDFSVRVFLAYFAFGALC